MYAYFTPNNYTVYFNANGGNTPNPTSKTVTYDSTYGTLASISRTGYTFNGWYTASSGGTQITNSTKVSITSNQTLYAHWTANNYTVSFNANGGNTPNPTSKTVTYDSTYGTLASVSRTGYTFNGWYTASSGGKQITNSTKVSITSNQTLYAHWTPNSYTVYFNANGGNTPNPTSKTVTYASTYGTLASVSKTGYTFNGWYTASSGGIQITDSTKVSITSNQTLYAHWTVNSYSVSISAGTGGSVSKSSMSINYGGTNTFTVTPNSGYYLESISCTNGYISSGYSTGMSSTSAQTVTISNNSQTNGSICTISFKPVTIYENGSCNIAGCNANKTNWSFEGSSCYDSEEDEWQTEIANQVKGPEFNIDVTNVNYIYVDYTITAGGSTDAYTYTAITAFSASKSSSSFVTIECVKEDEDADNYRCDPNTTTKSGTLVLDVRDLTGIISFSIKYETDTNGFNRNYCYNNSGGATVKKIYTS